MSKINELDIIGNIYENKYNQKYKVLMFTNYDIKYFYEILFLETNNIYTQERNKIKSNNCIDTKENKKNREIKASTKQKFIKRSHKETSVELYITSNKDIPILVLDQATIKTGYSVYNGNKLIKYGLIDFSDNDCFFRRINLMNKSIYNLIEKYSIKLVVIEDIFLGKNVDTFMKLSSIRALITNTCIDNNIDIRIIKSSSWKSYVNIVPKIDQKLQSKNKVKELFGLNISDDNICDSILIGHYVINEIIRNNKINSWNKTIVEY